MPVEESTIFVVWLSTLHILVREQDQSRGPLERFRGLLLLTRWLSVSCSVLTGHIYYSFFFLVQFFFLFFSLSHVLGPPPTPSCHPVASVLSLRLQLFLSFLLLFLVMFFFYKKKKKEKKNPERHHHLSASWHPVYNLPEKKRINMKIILHKNQTETTSKSCIGCRRNDRSFYCFN